MNIFTKKAKKVSGAYYFGEYNDKPLAPFSISIAVFDTSYAGESLHYHTQNQKVYLTLEGEGVLEVNGKEVSLNTESMIHVEPQEIHRVKSVIKAPFKLVVINSSKVDDKVIV